MMDAIRSKASEAIEDLLGDDENCFGQQNVQSKGFVDDWLPVIERFLPVLLELIRERRRRRREKTRRGGEAT